ncbi:MAG: hypothetical protein GY849_13345 [Deltaproteobacteria bacterium]|nr:hypothetical protein [Deltaproteobacteria bacterium]
MSHSSFFGHRFRGLAGNALETLESSSRLRHAISWLILLTGLIIWISAQGYLVLGPLWDRNLPPEVDDSLAYLVRTQEMETCFFQDCLALEDLRTQLHVDSPDPDITRQRQIAGFPFPFYHPLFSIILLFLKRWTSDLATAYKVLWSLGPLLFGLGFACLLSSLWGRAAAGFALLMLSFKVFPGPGLHYLTPANLAMGAALFLWARIIARQGNAPWTFLIGSAVMLALHPIGGIYAAMAALLAWQISQKDRRRRMGIVILILFSIVSGAVVAAIFVKQPSLFNPFDYLAQFPGIGEVVRTYLSNISEVLIQIVQIKDGLFGPLSLFGCVLAFGFFSAPKERRKTAARMILIYGVFLFGALYHTDPLWAPGSLFLRMWIPLVAILFGAVASGFCFALRGSLGLLKDRLRDPRERAGFAIQKIWPALVLALVLGYTIDTSFSGSEQIYATRGYMHDRQALRFDPSQPELLMSQAKPGDRVLYTSTMVMAFYFIHGALEQGAVYYHPVFKGTKMTAEWLKREDLRFAAAYNPTVYHPSLEGLDEKNRCITDPVFHFTPLSKERAYGPIDREGLIPAGDFRWVDVAPRVRDFPKDIKILIRNPGKSSAIVLVPMGQDRRLLWKKNIKTKIRGQWAGWIKIDLKVPNAKGFRIILPKGKSRFLLGGIAFGDDSHHWPWAQRADVILMGKDPNTGRVILNFDPARILPPPLNRLKISVLNDSGSSVLFKIDR